MDTSARYYLVTLGTWLLGKRQFRRICLRRNDVVKKGIEPLGSGWKVPTADRLIGRIEGARMSDGMVLMTLRRKSGFIEFSKYYRNTL